MSTEINWVKIQEANKAAREAAYPGGMWDAIDDNAVDVTCQLLEDLGINPHPSGEGMTDEEYSQFCDARAAVEAFVEIALLRSGIFSDGSPLRTQEEK